MSAASSWRADLAAHFAVTPAVIAPVSGGSSPACSLSLGEKRLFIKLLDDEDSAWAEVDGLRALAQSPFRVPAVDDVLVLASGVALVLEWLPLTPLAPVHRPALVSALQALHRLGAGQSYGWDRDNRIGPALQCNTRAAHWGEFFARQRLAPQLSRARGLPAALSEALAMVVERCPRLLPATPPAALLHGDLWAGNLGWCGDRPALYDPAVYVGDPLVDLAMLKLFGEPVPGLVAACVAGQAPTPDSALRERVYDLYHLLNHYNLFGSGWLSALADCCRAVIREDNARHEGGS